MCVCSYVCMCVHMCMCVHRQVYISICRYTYAQEFSENTILNALREYFYRNLMKPTKMNIHSSM